LCWSRRRYHGSALQYFPRSFVFQTEMKQAGAVSMRIDPSGGTEDRDQDRRISEANAREQSRLRNFIRKRVPNAEDAEDILQEAFAELVETLHLMRPVEHIGPWLFRVARNRIIDLYRKRKPEVSTNQPVQLDEEGGRAELEDLLPSPDAGPEAVFARSVLLEELSEALEELPDEQREVFVAHEIEGRSFKEISAESGVSVNTLLSRKHYAVLQLRERLHGIYEEFRKG
jgi:RNA polymerase sigma factor (sigma-70 family)